MDEILQLLSLIGAAGLGFAALKFFDKSPFKGTTPEIDRSADEIKRLEDKVKEKMRQIDEPAPDVPDLTDEQVNDYWDEGGE